MYTKKQKCINTLFVLRQEKKYFFDAYFSSGAEADKFITEMEEQVTPKQFYFWDIEDVKITSF